MSLAERFRAAGLEVSVSARDLALHSRDTSIFAIRPALVVYPKSAEEVSRAVSLAHEARVRGEEVSITARAGGTDMTGGPLTSSVVLSFTKHMNRVREVGSDYAITEPGVYYRDFEKRTLARGLILPSYPASRDIAALGGMLANNAGGERSLSWGKTAKFVRELSVVLSDGSRAILKPLARQELEEKKKLQNLEGDIYRKMHRLIECNRDVIRSARPKVSKNSSGYALWDVEDSTRGTFDLTKLLVGSQGTLALITEATIGLVPPREHRAMLVIFLPELSLLPEIVRRTLAICPESFESYDDQTFRLALRFLPQIFRKLGISRALSLAFSFLPELRMLLSGGVPRLVLIAEFAEASEAEAKRKCRALYDSLRELAVPLRIARGKTEMEKYWTIRRESFNLLRQNLRGLTASPFIDDIVVDPSVYPKFLPELRALLEEHDLIYTIAGHVGNGNFHIIPLMDLTKESVHHEIAELTRKVHALVFRYKGSMSGEHNDGIIRTPYVPQMFGSKVYDLFREVKTIFDPLGVFNPGKKVGGSMEAIERYMVR